MDKLKLLSYANDYKVTKDIVGYDVEDLNSDLSASIYNKDNIDYYMRGLYNSGSDTVDIDVDALEKLKDFCVLLANK